MDVPPDLTEPALQTHAPTARLALAVIDLEVAQEHDRFHNRIRDLDASRQAIQQDLQALIYPVLTLPPEITSRIFVHSLSPHAWLRSLEPPLVFLRVCKQWADIAAATPELWTFFGVNMAIIEPQELQDVVGRWFKCSRGRQLDRVVLAGDFSESWYGRQLLQKVHLLNAATVELHFALTPANIALVRALSLGSHCLKELILDAWEDGDGGGDLIVLDRTFADAPGLTSLCLKEPTFCAVAPSWNQLTSLQCGFTHCGHVLDSLRLLPQLRRLHAVIWSGDNRSERDNLVHTGLREIRIEEQNLGSFCSHLLCFLSLPNLETLRINHIYPSELQAFFSSSGHPHITQLIVEGVTHDESDFPGALEPLLGVVSLRITLQSSEVAERICVSLAAREDFLPRLSELHIHLYRAGDVDFLVNFVPIATQARNWMSVVRSSVATIQRLSLVVSVQPGLALDIPSASLQRWRALKLNGVEVWFGSLNGTGNILACL